MGRRADRRRTPRVAVIGAGPGGICAVIALKDAGFDDVVVLERQDGVGGTWHQNRYPGCACDVPSHLYSFSFAVKRDWSRPYAPQPEILEYMEDLAESRGVLPTAGSAAGSPRRVGTRTRPSGCSSSTTAV